MQPYFKYFILLAFSTGANLMGHELTQELTPELKQKLTLEEQRLTNARTAMPIVFKRLDTVVQSFITELSQLNADQPLIDFVQSQANKLWHAAVKAIKEDDTLDDRSLYWSRLAMSAALKQSSSFQALSEVEQKQLLWQFELKSRGQDDLNFTARGTKKILVTGFDPFFLDRHIDQSNPSGATLLALDNTEIAFDGELAEIQAVILPVRYADFDQGMVEQLLSEYYRQVDMIVTISMGRETFDLERFPGLRRSAEAPDNLNVYTGANKKQPLIPSLDGKPLAGPEFVEFSLPVEEMLKASTPFVVNDNHSVETLEGKQAPQTLAELDKQIAVSGSGGGYLSNEIAYRSMLLRNALNPELPVGHIHTPRIKAFEPETTRQIIEQIRSMLQYSLKAI